MKNTAPTTCFGVELVLRNTEKRGNAGLEDIEIEHLVDTLGKKRTLSSQNATSKVPLPSVELDCGDDQRHLDSGEC